MSHVPVIALYCFDSALLPPQLRKLPYLQKPFIDPTFSTLPPRL